MLSYIEGEKTFEALSTVLKEYYRVSEDNICFSISDIRRHIIPAFNTLWKEVSQSNYNLLKQNNNWLASKYSVILPNSFDVTIDSTPNTFKCEVANIQEESQDLAEALIQLRSNNKRRIQLENKVDLSYFLNAEDYSNCLYIKKPQLFL
ncbi:hypothetical protein FQA39_LY04996 [Lamprigera yunnana]|nr:hypothetical protein FQA39_LY04996 [Lamprigera yunnana]